MSDALQALARRFAAYVAQRVPGARDVQVDEVERFHGGASRETFRMRLRYREGEGADAPRIDRGVVLRRDPAASLIETERAAEFAAYRAFHGTRVPVPEPLWLESDAQWLGTPFFVMEEIAGFEAGPQAITQPPYAAHAERIAEQKWTILGEIAKADPAALGLIGVFAPVAAGECWRRELAHWEAKLDRDEPGPQPITRAAIRWLRAHPPPPPARVGVVHGDYRTGNFLYDALGGVRAILDWEMAHLGDPLEDLAWSLSRIFCWGRDDRVGGLVPREQAIAIWERAAGRRADRAALHWWELFTAVKGQAIWLAAGVAFARGENRDPILAMPGLLMTNSQDRATLELLGRLP